MADSRTLDTGTSDLSAHVEDGVGTIVLDRPERRNALSDEMLAGLAEALLDFANADDVGAVLLTGAGKAFSSGGDVKDFAARGGEGGVAGVVDPRRLEAQRVMQRATVGRIRTMPKPVLGVLPGAAAGAALGIALACDLRIGSERALMITAFATVGLSGDYGTAWLLQHLVGSARAREMMFLPERIDARRCLELGLLNTVVPAESLDEEARALAHRLAHGPRQALAGMKQNLLLAEETSLGDAMDVEAALHLACGVTEDHREAVAAFVDKRPPVFGRPTGS